MGHMCDRQTITRTCTALQSRGKIVSFTVCFQRQVNRWILNKIGRDHLQLTSVIGGWRVSCWLFVESLHHISFRRPDTRRAAGPCAARNRQGERAETINAAVVRQSLWWMKPVPLMRARRIWHRQRRARTRLLYHTNAIINEANVLDQLSCTQLSRDYYGRPME